MPSGPSAATIDREERVEGNRRKGAALEDQWKVCVKERDLTPNGPRKPCLHLLGRWKYFNHTATGGIFLMSVKDSTINASEE